MTTEQRPRGGFAVRLARFLTGLEIGVGAIAVVAILVLVFYQALQRYLPIESVAWTGELARFALMWATFAGLGVLVTTRGHIALELVDSLRSRTAVRIVQTLALVIVAVVGILLANEAYGLITTAIVTSPVLRLPMSLVYIPVLIGAISTVIRALLAAADVAVHGPVTAAVTDDPEVASL